MSSNLYNTKKGKTLIVVEGEFDKKNLIFLCDLYPELKITEQDIIIFRTNIYELHSKIIGEYGDDWFFQDIDIAYLLTKEKNEKLYKYNFVNIYLIFDFERQDPFYDDTKILQMQEKFKDPTDNGRLYINFPMVEAFLDFISNSDENYLTRKMNMCNYGEYKNNTKTNSFHWEDVNNFFKVFDLLRKIGKKVEREYAWELLSDKSKLNDILVKINYTHTKRKNNYLFNLNRILNAYQNQSYKMKMKNIFNYCIHKTIEKSILIQDGFIAKSEYSYNQIDFYEVLTREINLYNDSNEIYVLGTWVLLVPEYNSKLIE